MVEVAVIEANNPSPSLLEKAAGLIAKGEVIVCPTDTGYAFTTNGLDPQAIAMVFNLKGRDFSNPIHVAVHSLTAAKKYAYVDRIAEKLAGRFLPGGLTLVLPKKAIVPAILVAGRDTIGIRLPDNKVILTLAAMTDLPLTTTSANISGLPTTYTVQEVIGQLSESIEKVALVLDQGAIEPRELSTIVDLTVSPPRLLRQGKISWQVIQQFLESVSK